jgi:hypothetical protein
VVQVMPRAVQRLLVGSVAVPGGSGAPFSLIAGDTTGNPGGDSPEERQVRPPVRRGRMAFISLIGTESWSDYGAVVLQMAILDTLLSIEEKLGVLTPPETET